MRRLPLYLVIDVSESMVGEPIRHLEEGIDTLIANLRTNPNALETVHVCIVAFAGLARTLTPLVDLITFYPPKIPIGGGTALGAALEALMDEMDKNKKAKPVTDKSDWKPMVFLITDGKPTDDPKSAIDRWNKGYSSKSTLITCTIGHNSDVQQLRQFSDHIISFEPNDTSKLEELFAWISDSVNSHSNSLGINDKPVSLEKFDYDFVTDVVEQDKTDPDFVILPGMCSTKKMPYLMKYERIRREGMERFIKEERFILTGCYALDKSYFNWSNSNYKPQSVNTGLLEGSPSCPHCSNEFAFSMCRCGKLLCVDRNGQATCPWCGNPIAFEMSQSHGDFDVSRGQG